MKKPSLMSENELRLEVRDLRHLLLRWLNVTHLGDASVLKLREDTQKAVSDE